MKKKGKGTAAVHFKINGKHVACGVYPAGYIKYATKVASDVTCKRCLVKMGRDVPPEHKSPSDRVIFSVSEWTPEAEAKMHMNAAYGKQAVAEEGVFVPMLLWCPECGERHIDEGEFATKPHHTHACQGCGLCWRPAIVPTCGVQFLPGFKNVKREGDKS